MGFVRLFSQKQELIVVMNLVINVQKDIEMIMRMVHPAKGILLGLDLALIVIQILEKMHSVLVVIILGLMLVVIIQEDLALVVIIQEDLALVVIIQEDLALVVIIQEDLALVVTKEVLKIVIRGNLEPIKEALDPIQEDLVANQILEGLYWLVLVIIQEALDPIQEDLKLAAVEALKIVIRGNLGSIKEALKAMIQILKIPHTILEILEPIKEALDPIQEDLVAIHKLEKLEVSSKTREYKLESILAHRTLHLIDLKQVPRVILTRQVKSHPQLFAISVTIELQYWKVYCSAPLNYHRYSQSRIF